MPPIDFFRYRNHPFIESVVTGLVSAEQQVRFPLWIEGVQDTQPVSATLDSKLAHRDSRALDLAAVWKTESDAARFKQIHDSGDRFRVLLIEGPKITLQTLD